MALRLSSESDAWTDDDFSYDPTEPKPYVRELGDEIRYLLAEPKAQTYVSQLVAETMKQEWEERLKDDSSCEQSLLRRLKGRNVQEFLLVETLSFFRDFNLPGKEYRRPGWVFPVLHGIDSSPGCFLILAGLNDYAAANPHYFDPRHKLVGPTESVGTMICYRPYVAGCIVLQQVHEKTLRDVIAATKADLEAHGICKPLVIPQRATHQTLPTRKPTVGRPKKYDPAKEKKLAEDWATAKGQGACKPEFARQKSMTVKDFDALLARVRNRKKLPARNNCAK